MDGNTIDSSELPAQLFVNSTALQVLSLQNMGLLSIDVDQFDGLTSLDTLYVFALQLPAHVHSTEPCWQQGLAGQPHQCAAYRIVCRCWTANDAVCCLMLRSDD